MKYQLTISGKNFDVDVNAVDKGFAKVVVNGRPYDVVINKSEGELATALAAEARPAVVSSRAPEPKPVAHKPAAPKPEAAPKPAAAAPASGKPATGGAGALKAPIPGVIMDIKVSVGAQVLEGETVVVLEAMKMENDLVAQMSGTIAEIRVQKGQQVNTGDVLLVIS